MTPMNLTLEPWIPALRADGRRELFSLQALFARIYAITRLAADKLAAPVLAAGGISEGLKAARRKIIR